jgi:hypothetical protein
MKTNDSKEHQNFNVQLNINKVNYSLSDFQSFK